MFLSPIEQAYLNGTRQFTKPQQRYIRYRLNKKLRLLSEELTSFGIPKDDLKTATPRQPRCYAWITRDRRVTKLSEAYYYVRR